MYRDDVMCSVLFLVLIAAVGTQAVRYPLGTSLQRVGPGFFPVVTLALLGICFLALLAQSLRDWRKNLRPRWPLSFGPPIWILAAVFGYGFFLPYLGFGVTTAVFSVLLYWRGYPRRPGLAVLGAIVTSGVMVLVFQLWLKIQFPKGWLGV